MVWVGLQVVTVGLQVIRSIDRLDRGGLLVVRAGLQKFWVVYRWSGVV